MARNHKSFVCQECGGVHSKWSGQCQHCNAWNTLVEESAKAPLSKGKILQTGRAIEFTDLQHPQQHNDRNHAGIPEFDRVCGGGLVPGSVVLVGGDPGIGKSTLLLQVAASMAQKYNCIYVSGEEAVDQIKMRAMRLGVQDAKLQLAAETHIPDIVTSLDRDDAPDLVIIDSIQTMYIDLLESAPGTVTQVRGACQELIRLAKKRNITIILVGHVTKEGVIAGPRVLEHMVDAVLYFEGERGHQFRILRGVKNRFGATDEIGVFEMTQLGLQEVPNPSAAFLSKSQGEVSGSVVFSGIEGTRPILVEIQALVAPSNLGTPRRAVIGWDAGRLSMVVAVLETRCGVRFGARDIYLNVAGGLKVQEPAADFAVAAALVSALSGIPVPGESVFFGEIGLSGEVRSVSQMESRLKESSKLGFKNAYLPQLPGQKNDSSHNGLEMNMNHVNYLSDLMTIFNRKVAKQQNKVLENG